jgi:hypothetical protein
MISVAGTHSKPGEPFLISPPFPLSLISRACGSDDSSTIAMGSSVVSVFSSTPLPSAPSARRSECEKKHVRGILKDLLDYSRQWEEVSIQLRLEDLNLLRGAKGHLPLLKRLDIDMANDDMGMVHPSFTRIFEDAPLLTHVAVGGIFAWEFNWSSLTSLDIGYQDIIARSLPILQKTVNLVELAVRNRVYEHDGHVAISGLIHLPHLEYLFILGDGLLTILKTPALRRLEIGGLHDASPFVKARVAVDFFHRSLLKLTLVENGIVHTSTI